MKAKAARIGFVVTLLVTLMGCKTGSSPTLSVAASSDPGNDPVGAITKVSQVKVNQHSTTSRSFCGARPWGGTRRFRP